ncbi:MAG: deaminase [Candidatus Omnitrophota bacterium]
MKIRHNRAVIIGLTGYLGSGCTELAKYMALKSFSHDVKKEIEKDNSRVIGHLYEQIDLRAKQLRSYSADTNPNQVEQTQTQLQNEMKSLKKELERREILNVARRHKREVKQRFFYISLSNIIIFSLIRHANYAQKGSEIIEMLKRGLKSNPLNFSLEEAVSLLKLFEDEAKATFKNPFNVKTKNISKPDAEKIKLLFDNFYLIKDSIVAKHGKAILQDYGDTIRSCRNPYGERSVKGSSVSARELVKIADHYIRFLQKYFGYRFFVLECFKNAQELFYFREKYSYFYLFAIEVDRKIRIERSALNREEYDRIEQREKRPEAGVEKFAQLSVSRCMELADLVIKNNENNGMYKDLFWKILKYFALILEPGCLKPSENETLMHLAYTFSLRSNCNSRQVGAIITNAEGYVIGAGWNDVGEGQISCGQKMVKDYQNIDFLNHGKCLDMKNLDGDDYVCCKELFERNRDLHCVALHAEENAILQLAKFHSGVPFGSAIYITTYPCASCLKKISQIGIANIIYTQHYENPIREKILLEGIKPVGVESFEGVQYFSLVRLYKPYYDKKEQQQILKFDPKREQTQETVLI